MYRTNEELLELAYELIVVDNDTADAIMETLTETEMSIIAQMMEDINNRWRKANER